VAGGYAADGRFGGDYFDELLDAGARGGTMPGAEVGEWEEPWSPTSDVWLAADCAECVAGVECAVAFIEKAEVSGCVTGRSDAAERAEELCVRNQVRGYGGRSGKCAFHFALRFVRVERTVLRWDFEEKMRVPVRNSDVDFAEEMRECVEGADVVSMRVCEKNARYRRARAAFASGFEDGFCGTEDTGVDEREAVGLADEVAVDEAEARELPGVSGELGGLQRCGSKALCFGVGCGFAGVNGAPAMGLRRKTLWMLA
jgi:hypothetical protein